MRRGMPRGANFDPNSVAAAGIGGKIVGIQRVLLRVIVVVALVAARGQRGKIGIRAAPALVASATVLAASTAAALSAASEQIDEHRVVENIGRADVAAAVLVASAAAVLVASAAAASLPSAVAVPPAAVVAVGREQIVERVCDAVDERSTPAALAAASAVLIARHV